MRGGGAGSSRGVVLTVGAIVSSSTYHLSYDAFISDNSSVSNIGIGNNNSVSVVGASFGIGDSSLSVRVGYTIAESTEWSSSTSTMCRAALGISSTVALALTVGLSTASISDAVSYDRPSLTGGPLNIPIALGLGVKTFPGTNLGIFDSSASLRASTSCEETGWASDSSVQCHAAEGLGRSVLLVVTLGSRAGTMSHVVSFNRGE
eukprot:474065-Rhodomonas_salina.1